MFSISSLVAVLATATLIDAHVEFIRLAHNGVWQPPLRYIRNRTNPWEEETGIRLWTFPTYPTDSPNSVRCGRDSLSWATKTETLKVKAGDEIEFLATRFWPSDWNQPSLVQWDDCPEGRGGCTPGSGSSPSFQPAHDGPASIYLSRVPDGRDITSYDGSGEWLKIFTSGVEFSQNGTRVYWLPVNGARLIAKLPVQTPAGQYLLRIEQIWPGAGKSALAQEYHACAHIEVETNPQAKQLPAGVKIPEILCEECPGMEFNFDRPELSWLETLNGTLYPGGPIWDGVTLREDRVVPVIRE